MAVITLMSIWDQRELAEVGIVVAISNYFLV